MAKKNNDKIEIKTKKVNSIIYNQNYIVIDSYYIIHKEYAILDDALLQDKINKDIPFAWSSLIKHIYPQTPNIKPLIPVFDTNYTPLEDTNIYTTLEKNKS